MSHPGRSQEGEQAQSQQTQVSSGQHSRSLGSASSGRSNGAGGARTRSCPRCPPVSRHAAPGTPTRQVPLASRRWRGSRTEAQQCGGGHTAATLSWWLGFRVLALKPSAALPLGGPLRKGAHTSFAVSAGDSVVSVRGPLRDREGCSPSPFAPAGVIFRSRQRLLQRDIWEFSLLISAWHPALTLLPSPSVSTPAACPQGPSSNLQRWPRPGLRLRSSRSAQIQRTKAKPQCVASSLNFGLFTVLPLQLRTRG